jgi:hypothetical protein
LSFSELVAEQPLFASSTRAVVGRGSALCSASSLVWWRSWDRVRDARADAGASVLPALEVHGLRYADARALLGSTVAVTLDEQVRDQIIAETRGNPLALIELPRGLTALQLADGFGKLDAEMLDARIEESYLRRLQPLSDDAGRLLLLAAADPLGDPLLLRRAAERLLIAPAVADEVAAHGLLTIGDRVMFRHSLVRSAVYFSAAAPERRVAHQALAEATDGDTEPDRRAWHPTPR